MAKLTAPVRVEGIIRAILVLRGHRVLLDEMLAELYGVETKVLIQGRFEVTVCDLKPLNS